MAAAVHFGLCPHLRLSQAPSLSRRSQTLSVCGGTSGAATHRFSTGEHLGKSPGVVHWNPPNYPFISGCSFADKSPPGAGSHWQVPWHRSRPLPQEAPGWVLATCCSPQRSFNIFRYQSKSLRGENKGSKHLNLPPPTIHLVE